MSTLKDRLTLIDTALKTHEISVAPTVREKINHYTAPQIRYTPKYLFDLFDLRDLRHLAADLHIDSNWLITGEGHHPLRSEHDQRMFVQRLTGKKAPVKKKKPTRPVNTQHIEAMKAMASAK